MEHAEHTRRDFIKKGAMVGGVAWAAPTILSVGTAHAQTPLYQCCPTCTASATGLRVNLPLLAPVSLGVATGPSQTCNPVTVIGTVINTGTACGSANSAQCTASGELVGSPTNPNATTTITVGTVLISARVLRSQVRCGPNGIEGSSTIVGLVVAGTPITLATNCQLTINIAGVIVRVNEQVCNNGRLTVRALHVSSALLGIDVVAGEASAGAPGCACVAAPAC